MVNLFVGGWGFSLSGGTSGNFPTDTETKGSTSFTSVNMLSVVEDAAKVGLVSSMEGETMNAELFWARSHFLAMRSAIRAAFSTTGRVELVVDVLERRSGKS